MNQKVKHFQKLKANTFLSQITKQNQTSLIHTFQKHPIISRKLYYSKSLQKRSYNTEILEEENDQVLEQPREEQEQFKLGKYTLAEFQMKFNEVDDSFQFTIFDVKYTKAQLIEQSKLDLGTYTEYEKLEERSLQIFLYLLSKELANGRFSQQEFLKIFDMLPSLIEKVSLVNYLYQTRKYDYRSDEMCIDFEEQVIGLIQYQFNKLEKQDKLLICRSFYQILDYKVEPIHSYIQKLIIDQDPIVFEKDGAGIVRAFYRVDYKENFYKLAIHYNQKDYLKYFKNPTIYRQSCFFTTRRLQDPQSEQECVQVSNNLKDFMYTQIEHLQQNKNIRDLIEFQKTYFIPFIMTNTQCDDTIIQFYLDNFDILIQDFQNINLQVKYLTNYIRYSNNKDLNEQLTKKLEKFFKDCQNNKYLKKIQEISSKLRHTSQVNFQYELTMYSLAISLGYAKVNPQIIKDKLNNSIKELENYLNLPSTNKKLFLQILQLFKRSELQTEELMQIFVRYIEVFGNFKIYSLKEVGQLFDFLKDYQEYRIVQKAYKYLGNIFKMYFEIIDKDIELRKIIQLLKIAEQSLIEYDYKSNQKKIESVMFKRATDFKHFNVEMNLQVLKACFKLNLKVPDKLEKCIYDVIIKRKENINDKPDVIEQYFIVQNYNKKFSRQQIIRVLDVLEKYFNVIKQIPQSDSLLKKTVAKLEFESKLEFVEERERLKKLIESQREFLEQTDQRELNQIKEQEKEDKRLKDLHKQVGFDQ